MKKFLASGMFAFLAFFSNLSANETDLSIFLKDEYEYAQKIIRSYEKDPEIQYLIEWSDYDDDMFLIYEYGYWCGIKNHCQLLQNVMQSNSFR